IGSDRHWSLFRDQVVIVGLVLVPALVGEPWILLVGLLLLVRGLYEVWGLCTQGRKRLLGGVCWFLPPLLIVQIGLTVDLARGPDGFSKLMWVYMFTEIFDVGAYIIGKRFGRHTPFPRLSPHKSTEGLLGGVLLVLLVASVVNGFLYRLPWSIVVWQGAILLVAGLVGDLFYSHLKRRAGCKDFPAVSRHHGGVLDIYDALLMAAPIYWVMT
ncbi:MAG: phosphatidate cytidylyltransferase, partial [Magnetococcales bacterium]|nr:phosphatidate cytidylyltransferase [Magnetococcales bacterium]